MTALKRFVSLTLSLRVCLKAWIHAGILLKHKYSVIVGSASISDVMAQVKPTPPLSTDGLLPLPTASQLMAVAN